MKKLIFTSVLTIIALVGCTKSVVTEVASKQTIDFNPIGNNLVKASNPVASFPHDDFAVYGSYVDGQTTEVVFDGTTKVYWDDETSSWTYDYINNNDNDNDKVEWVDGVTYTFGAVAPYEASPLFVFDFDTKKYKSSDTVTLDQSNIKDYMVATVVERNSADSKSKISFTFNHILSKLTFKFVAEDIGEETGIASYTITKVHIENIQPKNIFTNNQWAVQATGTPYTIESAVSDGNPITLSSASTNATMSEEFLVIPQQINYDNASAGQSLSVNALLDVVITYNDSSTLNVTGAKAHLTAGDNRWYGSTNYIYTLKLNKTLTNAKYIEFEVNSVNGWTTKEVGVNVTM